ncbi:GNAT family N-acetyltransferase [Candidatus Micrarchaeota archaeon]|nr:GNAT family N-acetyltransferase [Candidatus Micrarchaeota archaeon]
MICLVKEICEHELKEIMPLIRKVFPNAAIELRGDDLFFVATMRGGIVGFMHLIEREEYFVLQGLGVDEQYRHNGAGNALMEKLEQVSDSANKKIYLKVKNNNPAVRLYESYGFTVKKFGAVHVLVKNRNN